VRARDGHIVEMVHEADNAWHAGHGWFNRHSIGIEHEGFAHRVNGGGYYNEKQYAASAALTCAIATHHNIPIDRQHIFGHGNVPSNLASHTLCSDASSVAGRCGGTSHHNDPGRYWKWNHYMNLVRDCVRAAR
jgi:N-acetyl-anhydromuramyl-L-alanine amidase AmpD